jgi:hypothetical protein
MCSFGGGSISAYAPESRIKFPVLYINKWVYKQARIKYNEYVHYIYTVYTIKQTNKTIESKLWVVFIFQDEKRELIVMWTYF